MRLLFLQEIKDKKKNQNPLKPLIPYIYNMVKIENKFDELVFNRDKYKKQRDELLNICIDILKYYPPLYGSKMPGSWSVEYPRIQMAVDKILRGDK